MKQIQLDKMRPIELNYDAYEEFESMTGVDIYDIKKVILSAKCQMALTFCALKQGDPNIKLTYDQMKEKFSFKIFQIVQEEFLNSMDAKKKD